jgi:hypothetical protein
MLVKKLTDILFLCLTTLVLHGCAQKEISDRTIFVDRNEKTQVPLYLPDTEAERRAYAEGIKHVLQDFKGKMQATESFVFDPGVIECGVEIPGRVVNGALIPSHEECVLIKPGAHKLQQSVILPSLD